MNPPNPANAGSLVGRRLGKYDVLALLALGGTAEIYLARIGGEAGFEKYVVVKCLHDHLADDSEFVHMFLDEARLGAQLDHSNIVQTLELGEENGRYYMVMEFLAGMSLAQIARKARKRVPGGRIPVELVLGMAAQACAGLHYAHQRMSPDGQALNVVHRDVSPQNLVITFEGMLKLVDFGIAKAELRETNTKSGTIKGKFAYMSPEQCLAQHIDRRTDIFALGTVVHELLTGRRLFKKSSTYETYQSIVAGNVPTPSSVNHELDPALDPVVMRALAYDRNQRYPTAEAFGEALLQVLHRRGKSVSPSDLARFFEQYFAQEIDEHAQRMRELIEGRQTSTLDEMVWDLIDGESDVAARMPDEGDLGGGDDEIEGEATRIELNPLEQVQRMHAEQGAGGSDDEATQHRGRPERPARRDSSTTLGKRTLAPGGIPPIKPVAPKQPAAAAPRPNGPAPSHGAPPAARGKSGAAGRGAPPASRPAPVSPPAAAPPSAAAAEQRTMLAGQAPSQADIERAAAEADRLLGGPPPAAAPPSRPAGLPSSPPGAAADQKTMMAGEAPSPEQIAAAARQADAVLGRAPAPAPTGPTAAEQKTMLAGEAPSPAQIAAAAAEADRVLGSAPAPQPPTAGGAGDDEREAFPPIHTPTAFRQRGELIADQPIESGSGDLAALASERSATGGPPIYVLALAFVLSAGVGLGVTVLIGTLLG